MLKTINVLILIIFCFFFFMTYKYYSSNKNIDNIEMKRNNIDIIIKDKISDLPVLQSDIDNAIQFNDSFSDEINEKKKRNFWDLLKFK